MNTLNLKSAALIGAAILGLAAIANGASAAGLDAGAKTSVVRYADLNLDTTAGAKVLFHRIRNAAEKVCGDVGSLRLQQVVAMKACMNQAIVSSVRAVGNGQLDRVADTQGYEVQSAFHLASAR